METIEITGIMLGVILGLYKGCIGLVLGLH